MQPADTVYDKAHPWQSNEERLIGQALGANAGMSIEDIQAIRPPIPRIGLNPDRFGYDRTPIGIMDVLDVGKSYPLSRVDYSGNRSGMAGSSAPSLGVM